MVDTCLARAAGVGPSLVAPEHAAGICAGQSLQHEVCWDLRLAVADIQDPEVLHVCPATSLLAPRPGWVAARPLAVATWLELELVLSLSWWQLPQLRACSPLENLAIYRSSRADIH